MTPTPPDKPTNVEAIAEPPSKIDELLLEGFAQDLINQISRLDDLAKQLITLQIAILGLYAIILKLAAGVDTVAANLLLMGFALAAWTLAQSLCFLSLWPKRREVDPDDLGQVQRYFSDGIRLKIGLLSGACLFTLVSVVLVMISIFR